jgi:Arc/MetJ-type ribon-helix-helix transcriptional regulator
MIKVSFAEVDEAYLRSKVENGYYSSLSEATVRKQRESEQNRLLTALEIGEKAIQEGQIQPFTRELFDEVIQDGISKARSG